VTSVLDGYAAYKDFERGDYVGGAFKVTQSVGGVIVLASPAAGPFAPVVAAVGVGVSVVGWLGDMIFGEDVDPEEELLRKLGVYG
jgi:hypothetical protein